ncbi:MAG TPA: sigma-70 family RNA polymerase sigma factor [Hyphomicrobiaceae bacterium]|jgi:RNA polymerase sigma-70 factor (ECF subfamily)
MSLLANVLLGDPIAKNALVDHIGPIIRHAVHSLARPEMREDLVQEVWVHLWDRSCRVLQRFSGEGPFLGFVWIVARNQALDRLPAALRRPTVPLDEAPELVDPDDPELNVAMMQLTECIKRAREHLAPAHQEVIHLRHDLGLKHREIAEQLNIPIGTVAKSPSVNN